MVHLRQEGFTEAEIYAYSDDARAVLRGKPSPLRWTPPDRLRGMLMARDAKKIRDRQDRRPWAAPVIGAE